MPVTLKQLARELNLHHSTVAYALSGKGTVKEATRQRVREAAAKLGYIPNGLARRMRSRKTNVLGVVAPDVLVHHNEFMQQAFRLAHERGYDLQISLTENSAQLEDRAVRFLMESRVDGLILMSTFSRWEDVPETHVLRQLQPQGFPTVAFGTPIEGSPFPALQLPAFRIGEVLGEHLLQGSHSHLAWLFPVKGPLARPQHLQRVAGTRRAMTSAKLDPQVLSVLTLPADQSDEPANNGEIHSDYLLEVLPKTGVERGRQLMRMAMAQSPRPTGVLCLHASTAIGAMTEAQAMGLRVPEDVAIVASNRGIAADVSPLSLTTAFVSPAQAAREAIDLLFETMKSKDATVQSAPAVTEIEPTLVIGTSSKR